ncbi:MAG: chitobiase/beta-hexosaminidase C-terminal domain-containing protein, partial [Lachnospiraceae bacterium]
MPVKGEVLMNDFAKQSKAKKKGRPLSRLLAAAFGVLWGLTFVGRAAAAEEEVFVPSDITAPEFSAGGGFYEEGFELTITAPEGLTVYYTLDGSEPRVGSAGTNAYTEPIRILSYDEQRKTRLLTATVVRAVSVTADGEYGDVQTHTYFVAEAMKTRYAVPVVSIVTDPDSLYDEETGIFVNPTESGREWERPAHFEYFLPDGTRELSMN